MNEENRRMNPNFTNLGYSEDTSAAGFALSHPGHGPARPSGPPNPAASNLPSKQSCAPSLVKIGLKGEEVTVIEKNNRIPAANPQNADAYFMPR